MKKFLTKSGLLTLLVLFGYHSAYLQCTTAPSGQFPSTTFPLNQNTTSQNLSTCAYTGEYSVVSGVQSGKSYTVGSSIATNYITITSEDGLTVVNHGIQPFTFVAPSAANLRVYRHDDAACGVTASGCRTITMVCSNCVPPPPPANDDCAGAIALTVNSDLSCGVTTNGTTVSATSSVETAPSCSATGVNDDVWYSFTATATAHQVRITGATNATAVAVYTGSCGALTQISGACASTSSGTANLNLTVLTAGTTYRVRVYTTSSTVGTSATFTICVGTTPPPPLNDLCSGAILLTQGTSCITTVGNTNGATDNNETGDCTNGTENAVWYQFVATGTTAIVTVDGGVGFDAVVGVISTCGTSTRPTGGTCTDATLDDGVETLNLSGLTIGVTYFVQVHDYQGDATATATFSICVYAPPPPPANDNCAGAIAFPTVPTNGDCVTLTGNTISATQSQAACAGSGADDDIWFSFVAPGSTIIVDLTAISGSSDRVHEIFSSTCGSLVSVKCSDPENSTTTGLIPGNTYFVRVHTYFTGTTSTFNICLKTPRPVPANDLCANAIPLTCGQTLTGYTESSTLDNAPTCNSLTNTSPGVWYAFTGNGGTATISLCGSAFDTRLSVYTGTCGTFTCVTADDDTCDPGLQSIVSFATTPCVTYYVLVHGFSSAVGNFTIAATCTAPPAPPANDVCSGAETVTCGSTIAGNTSTATPDGGYCRSCNDIGGGRGVWYKLTGNGAQVTLNLCGSSFNTTVDVYSGSCASLIPVVSNDNDGVVCMSNRSRAVFNASVGTDYYILVSGVAECDLGAFTMNISCLCGPTLSAPWTVNNIGSSNGNGIDNVCNGTIDISASNFGSPSSDVQTFANQEFCGNFTITAKLESVTNLGWGGLMVRENDAPGSKKVALRTQLNSLFVRDLRATTNGVQSQQQWSRPTHSWMRITRTGNTFIGYTSFNGVNWQQTFIATLVLPTCIDAGLFAQSINVNTPTLAAFSNLGGFNTQIPNITDQNTENRSIETEKEFSVYPNPASDAVNVKWISGYNGKAANINIINQLGQVVVTQKISAVTNDTENIDISHLTDGMYIISVQSEDKQTVYRKFTVGSIRP